MVADETRKFFVRGLARYTSTIGNNPWRKGMSGGGAPVATGNLRDDAHRKEINAFSARIFIDERRAPYAPYVHGIEGYPRKRSYQLRPWLSYAMDTTDIRPLEDDLLKNIVADLAK